MMSRPDDSRVCCFSQAAGGLRQLSESVRRSESIRVVGKYGLVTRLLRNDTDGGSALTSQMTLCINASDQ